MALFSKTDVVSERYDIAVSRFALGTTRQATLIVHTVVEI